MRIALSHRHTAALLFIAASAIGTSASAHTGAESHIHNSFLSGFAHPLFGLDHLAAMVAVGLWSALAARSAGRDLLWGPVGFAAMLLVGAVLGGWLEHHLGFAALLASSALAALLGLASMMIPRRWVQRYMAR